ncbi:MAG: hypothetical protein OWU33_09925 [Firmicutes bacterium]|nr:hypothetical protein [Bacillota bacterium]
MAGILSLPIATPRAVGDVWRIPPTATGITHARPEVLPPYLLAPAFAGWVQFLSPTTGFATVSHGNSLTPRFGYAGTATSLMVTQNGGASWEIQRIISDYWAVTGADFLTARQGWLTTAHGLYRTQNGGITWIAQR